MARGGVVRGAEEGSRRDRATGIEEEGTMGADVWRDQTCYMRSCISIRGCVRPSLNPSVGRQHTSGNQLILPFFTQIEIDKGLKQENKRI